MKVKDAVGIANEYLAELFTDEGAHGFALQEVEFLENPDRWSITLSSFRLRAQSAGETQFINFHETQCRQVTVLEADGRVTSVKIRETA